MYSLFNDRAAIHRLQEGASAFQQNNPHFNQLLDVASGLMYNTGANGLNPADRRGLSMVMATLQNSVPGMGTPVADFVAMNRALISGAMPVTTVGTDGSRSSSNSYGTGNVSVAATASIMRTFEESMRTKSGAVDIGQTMGLSHNLRTSLLTQLVQERGINKGDIVSYDLGDAKTASALGEKIKQMKSENVEESSLRNLEKVQNAMQFLQKKMNSEDLSGKDSADLFANLEGHFDESTIKQTVAQIKGKNTNFQTQTKQLNQDLKEAYKDVAENVKELSNLFQTEDLEQLRSYAKGAGIGNFLDKAKAHEVRAQMRDIAVTAAVSGRTAQEVAAERIQIATGMSSMYGGRVVSGDLISVVQNAGVAAAQAKDGGVFTKEAAQAAATRSIANMQNVYSGAIITTSLFKQQEKLGGVTDEMRAEFNAMDAAHRKATAEGKTDQAQLISMQMESWSRRHFGDEAVDSPEARDFANANYSGEFQTRHAEAIKAANVRTHVNNMSEKYGLDEAGKAKMEGIGTKLIETFGNNQGARDKFFSLVDAGSPEKTKEAMEMLAKSGMSSEEAANFVQEIQGAGKGTVSAMWNPLLTNSRFMQQLGSGNYGKAERNVAFMTELLSGEKINTEKASTINGIVSGMLAEGGITVEGAADVAIANALHRAGTSKDKAEQNKLFREELDARGLSVINIGQAVEDENGKATGAFKLDDPEQRANMRKLLNVNDEELTELLSSSEDYIKRLEGAGINVSLKNKDSINGGILGYTRSSATQLRDRMSANFDQDAVKSMQQVLGQNAVYIEQNEKGEYETRVRLPNAKEGETVSLSEAVSKLKQDPSNTKVLSDLSAAGNTEATAALSGMLKNAYGDDISKETLANLKSSGDAVAALSDYQGDVTASMFQHAVEKTYGTANVEIFKNTNLEDWVAEGLATKDFDAKGNATYKLTKTIGALGLTEGADLTKDTVEGLAKKTGEMGRIDAVSKRMSGLVMEQSKQPVNSAQMSDAIKLLQRIATNTE